MVITSKLKGTADVAMLGMFGVLTACAADAQQAAAPQQSATTQSSAAPQLKEFDSLDDARRAVADGHQRHAG
jgi:hypothetical protein